MPLVNAEINVLNQVHDFYNINDKIPLNLVLTYTQEVSGFVKANIECDNKALDYYVTPFIIKPSKQELSIPELTLTKSMLGRCSLNVIINNNEGSLIDKKVVKVFEVSDLLILTYSLDKTEVSPEDKINIQGSIKNIRGEEIKSGQVIINIDNSSFTSNLENSKFEFTYNVPKNIKSKNHKVIVSFEDNYENKASKEIGFYVNPKPLVLRNLLNKLEFKPGEIVEIEALLYDQAGDLIENNAQIKVYDPKDKLIKEGTYKLSFQLENNSLPGSWIIKTSTDEFKIQSTFDVEAIRDVEFYVEDGILYIRNTGNTGFEDVAEIKVGDYTFSKKVDINPGEITAFDLSDQVQEGKYDVNVELNNELQEFKDVEVPRNPILLVGYAAKKLGDTIIERPYLLAIMLAIIVLYLFFRHKIEKGKRFAREKDVQRAVIRMQELRKDKETQKFKPKKFSEMSEEELKDYRGQILKNLKRKEDESSGYLSRKPQDKGSFGFFK